MELLTAIVPSAVLISVIIIFNWMFVTRSQNDLELRVLEGQKGLLMLHKKLLEGCIVLKARIEELEKRARE